eukprot:365916_1
MNPLSVFALLYALYVATILTVLDAADPDAPNVKCDSARCIMEYDVAQRTKRGIVYKRIIHPYTFQKDDVITITDPKQLEREEDPIVFKYMYKELSFKKIKKDSEIAASYSDVDVTNVLIQAWGVKGVIITIRNGVFKKLTLDQEMPIYARKVEIPKSESPEPNPPVFECTSTPCKLTYDYIKKKTAERGEYFQSTPFEFEDQDLIVISSPIPKQATGETYVKFRYNKGKEGKEKFTKITGKTGVEDTIEGMDFESVKEALVNEWGSGVASYTPPRRADIRKMIRGKAITIVDKDGAIVRFVPIKDALKKAAVNRKIDAKVTSVSGGRARDAYVNMMDEEYGYSLGEQTASAVASDARMELVDQYYYDAEVEAAREELALKRLERERARASLPRRKRSKYRNRYYS